MLDTLDTKEKQTYLDDLVRKTIDCKSSQIHTEKTDINLENDKKAFQYLLENNESLTQEKIIQIGNLVNDSSPYISRGYRKIGKYLADTQITIPEASKIPAELEKILGEYQKQEMLESNPFEQEAKFHIGFIRTHPFEDGNKRTARLILNTNLLHKNIAPVVITEDLLEYYYSYIENNDIEGMANLFKIQSKNKNK